MVRGLSHITFIVRDLDRIERSLTTVFGARKVYDSGGETFSTSRERFFLAGGEAGDADAPAPIWLAIMEGDPLPTRSYNHVAFKIAEEDYEPSLAAVRVLGLDVLFASLRPQCHACHPGRRAGIHDHGGLPVRRLGRKRRDDGFRALASLAPE